MNEDLVRL